ncbi:MAG: CpaD family pilus assembly lipoprotein [Kiloniellales bacterium]|nr:CpaD family pilus assembly lipoprotein [Kiloniellales bacterium]
MTIKQRFLTRTLLPVLALLPMTACAGFDGSINEGLLPLASWSPTEWDAPAQAEWVRLRHRVAFGSDSMELDRVERERLAAFLQESKVTARDDVFVSAPRASDGTIDPTDLARLDAIRGELRILGLNVQEGADDPLIAPDSIGIVIRRAVVMMPDCEAEEAIIPGVRPELRVGCATAYNLGAMVAFPEDLIEGRGLSPADGTKGATSVERYRTDKVKKIERERTSDL